MKTQRQIRHARAKALRLAAKRATIANDLAPGERLLANYSHVAAECDCPPTHNAWSVDAIAVARSGGSGKAAFYGGTNRCLGCGATWPAKQYDDDRVAA